MGDPDYNGYTALSPQTGQCRYPDCSYSGLLGDVRMTVYMKKVYGFSEPGNPLKFSSEKLREDAIAKLERGDTVILVGTKGKPTRKEDRGRILGMVEPTKKTVDATKFPHDKDLYNENGEYPWPYGLSLRQAWKFPANPCLSEVTTRKFSRASASRIVCLLPRTC